MNKKFFTTLVLLCAMVLSAWAYFASLDGKWTGNLNFNNENVPLTYNFKVDGDKLTGTFETSHGNGSIENGKVNGDSFTFSTNIQGLDIPHTGKAFTDSVSLDIDVQGSNYHTTLKRAQ